MMKKILTLIIFFVLAVSICSCGKDAVIKGDPTPSYTVDEHGRPIIHTIYIENIADYTVVRSDTSSNTIRAMASDLRTAISDYIGSQIKVGTDYGTKGEYEILLGETNRPESKRAIEGLGYNDYVIKLDGSKIVIAGGSEASLVKAMDEFLENFMFEGMVVVPNGEGLLYSPNYKFEKISVDGKDISEFKVYSTNADASALFVQKISDVYSGQQLSAAEKMEAGSSYIVLQPTSMDYVSYSAEMKDGNLYVSGSYKSCVDFLDYYVKKGEKNVNVKGKIEGKLDAPVIYTKDQLMSVLQTVYEEDTIILGEQTNTNAYPSDVLSRFYKATGKYPGMIGIDVGGYGLKLTSGKCSDERKSQIFCELVEFAEMGGIVQIHTHMVMPTETWNPDEEVFRSVLSKDGAVWDSLLTEGTPLNETFDKALAIEAEYVKYFHDIGVPVLWRPFHEMNANWFWWGVSQEGKTIE